MVAEESLPVEPTVFNDFSRHAPLENFYTIDGLLRSHAAELDQKSLICYPLRGVSDFEEHTAEAIDRYTNAAVQHYMQNGLQPADTMLEKAPVVGLLAPSSFEVILTIFALNRLGLAILFLSPRLTPSAHARLLELAGCNTLIVSDSTQRSVKEIQNDRPACKSVALLPRSAYRDVLSPSAFERPDIDTEKESKKIAFIVHSSGSTGFPKPIFLTNYQCLANFRKSFAMRAFCTSPLFHSHGLMELFRAFYTRATMYLGNYALPITCQNLLEAMNVAQPELMCAVPYVLKLLAEKPEGIEALSRAKLVLFAGSSCPDELGDRLVAGGVNLVANYGATETGQIMTSFRPPGDREWQYMRLHKPVANHVLMDEIAAGVFECVGLDGLPSKGPSNSKPPYSEKNPSNSFRTADLFTRHPDPRKSNYYKYLSRLDDRITLVNGEKVLPIPIEGRIKQENCVREAVVFGFERSVPGVLIFRSSEHDLDLSDEALLEEVWPTVEAANARAETFSRIPKELVVVKGPEVTYPRTDKGTFIRAQVYQQFAENIENAYRQFDATAARTGGLVLNISELEQWILSKFRNDLKIPLPSADTDIFSAGVDSLQAMRIWRMIKSQLDLGPNGRSMSQNVVFEKGTPRALASYLYSIRTGIEDIEGEDEIPVMQRLIEKYSRFTSHDPRTTTTSPTEEVIVVTGGTGNLGAFTIDQLLHRQSVKEVWALVRATDKTTAWSRVVQSLNERHIFPSQEQCSRLRALPCDLSRSDLGLDQESLEYLLSSVTSIVHSAWAVNFNLGVRSFEQQHIKGTYNLLNFCLRSRLPKPAKFLFCSSVSTASGTAKPATIPERAIEDLRHAQNTGYGRSKLVAEHIVRNAVRSTGMDARVLRIGQLSGDQTHSLMWNETEAVPLMIRSALTTGALPALYERPSWLPVDDCARAVVDLALQDSDPPHEADFVYHLINPCTFSWTTGLLPALQRCMPTFEVVDPRQWLCRLEQSEQDPAKNPSIKLLDFWKHKYATSESAGDSHIGPSGLSFETARTIQYCPSLADIKDPVSTGLMKKYVEVWLKAWL